MNMNKETYDLRTDNTLLASLVALEKKHNVKLLPKRYNDTNDLGVLYAPIDADNVQITFFNKRKTTSFFDVIMKAKTNQFNIVGEDCIYFPFNVIKSIIPPTQRSAGNKNSGTLNFNDFRTRWASSMGTTQFGI